MIRRAWIVLAGILAMASPAAAAAAAIMAPAVVTVRVYSTAAEPPVVVSRALAAAAATLATADVDLVWRHCDQAPGTPLGAGCDRPLTTNELAIRFVRSGDAHAAARRPLGDALVDTRTGSGALATIYLDRVSWLAGEAGTELSPLLGRAMAHEISHLLLGTTRHERGGLMRAVWSCDDLRHARAADWMLTPKLRAQIHAAALRRQQPGGTVVGTNGPAAFGIAGGGR